jgi:uncharacterized circularly permuted ATP-grasp superfamily protein
MKKHWEKFENFLKREGVFEKYLENLYEQDEQLTEFEYPSEYVSAAFVWTDTNEGHNFWSDIDTKWYKELAKITE